MEQIQTVRQATSIVLQGSPKTCSRTLFLLPDGSGSATSYASLPRIDKDTCVIALNSPYIKDPSKLSHCSLGDLIEGYLNELRRRRPTGPYHLGGWSAGGILAYRLAQILSGDGEEVRSLILIDSPPPRGLDRLPQHFYEMCDSLNIFGQLGKKPNVEESKRRATKKPDWLIPHFNGVIDILHNYWAEPLVDSQCLKVSLIWACSSIMDDASLPPLMPHKDDTEGMKFLTEKRRDFSGNGWEDLFPGSQLVIEKAHGANHFSMMVSHAHCGIVGIELLMDETSKGHSLLNWRSSYARRCARVLGMACRRLWPFSIRSSAGKATHILHNEYLIPQSV